MHSHSGRRFLAWATCLAALASNIALIAILVVVVCTANIAGGPFALATAATVLGATSLFVLTTDATLLFLRFYGRLRLQGLHVWILTSTAALTTAVTTTLSLISFGLTYLSHDRSSTAGLHAWEIAGLAICAVYLLATAVFLTIINRPVLAPRSSRTSQYGNESFTGSELKDSPATINKSIFNDSPVSPWPMRPVLTSTPTRAHTANQSSLHPKSSRTRLLHQPSFQTIASSRASLEHPTPTAEDSFSTWPLDSPTYPASPTGLPPIPSSPSLPPPSPAYFAHESHIHPLFRSNSSIPPPLASPGTSITGHGGTEWHRPGSSASNRSVSAPRLRAVQSEGCISVARRKRAGTGLNGLDVPKEV